MTKFRIERILLEKNMIDKEDSTYDEVEDQKEKDIFFNIIVPNLES